MNFIERVLWPAVAFVRGLDPRTKLLMLLCMAITTFVVSGYLKLAVLLGVACVWAAASSRREQRAPRGRIIMWAAVSATAIGLGLWGYGIAGRPVAGPLSRFLILLLAGWAFSRSTPAGELASALQKMRCPAGLVLIFVAGRGMFELLSGEVRMAYDGARLRAACVARRRSLTATMAGLWRASVAFCTMMFLRADEMAAAAETRGFSASKRRTSLRQIHFALSDVLVAGGGCAAAALLCLV